MADLDRLTEVIEPEAKALGFELVRVKMMPSEAGDGGEALQIMAEDPATGQLVIEQCAALSRRVSDRIDALEVLRDSAQTTSGTLCFSCCPLGKAAERDARRSWRPWRRR